MATVVLESAVTAVADPVTRSQIPGKASDIEAGITFYTDDTATTVAANPTAGTVTLTENLFVNEYNTAVMTDGVINATTPDTVATTTNSISGVIATPAGVTGGTATHYILRVKYEKQ